MRTLVTKSILLLGRYAVLPVAGLAVALFIGWLVAFDAYPGMAVIALPVVLPITTVAIALPIGLLLPMPHARERNAVDEAAAPGLWAMWNELDDATPRSCRTLRIDPRSERVDRRAQAIFRSGAPPSHDDGRAVAASRARRARGAHRGGARGRACAAAAHDGRRQSVRVHGCGGQPVRPPRSRAHDHRADRAHAAGVAARLGLGRIPRDALPQRARGRPPGRGADGERTTWRAPSCSSTTRRGA